MSRLSRIAGKPQGEYSNEEMLRAIIENTVSEVYEGGLSARDIENIADAILEEEREYLRDLRIRIESNKED